jgi:hypothetical protein
VSKRQRSKTEKTEAHEDDDARIVEALGEAFPDCPFVERNFRRGLEIAMGWPECDRIRLVQHFANRRAETDEAASACLCNLRDALLGG